MIPRLGFTRVRVSAASALAGRGVPDGFVWQEGGGRKEEAKGLRVGLYYIIAGWEKERKSVAILLAAQ